MSIIFDRTSDNSSPVELRGNHYSLGRDDGQSLMSRMSTAFLRQTGKYENNTGPTAQILKHLPLTPGWWDKTRFSGEYKETEVGVYMCRMISDHRTFCYPDVKNAEDNIMDLDFPKFVLLGADKTIGPGTVVKVRIDNNATLHTSDIAGTIEKIIDPDATLDQFSQNCSVEIPKQGGTERTTLGECSISVGSDGRRIKISDKEVPNPPKGVWPKSPITGKRAPDTIQDPVARLAQIGTINSGFPTRNNSSDAHKGIDLRTFKNGQPGSVPVKAALDGEVWTGVINGYGNVAVIKHTAYIAPTLGSVFYTLYAHLASFSVPNGKSVKRGSQIGLSGNTVGPGRRESVPFHLHFEVIYENNKNWKTVNDVIAGGAVDPVEDFFYKKFEKK